MDKNTSGSGHCSRITVTLKISNQTIDINHHSILV